MLICALASAGRSSSEWIESVKAVLPFNFLIASFRVTTTWFVRIGSARRFVEVLRIEAFGWAYRSGDGLWGDAWRVRQRGVCIIIVISFVLGFDPVSF